MGEDTTPIEDDELLYRRIPASTGWYTVEFGLKSEAFAPHRTNDATGLSLSRARFKTAAEAARGQQGKSYFIAVLRAGDLRARAIAVKPRPLPDDPGHAELPDLNSANRKADLTLERQRLLVELTIRMEGPFHDERTQSVE